MYDTSVVKFLHFVFMIFFFFFFFSFFVFSDPRTLNIESENNNTKTLIAEASYIGLGSLVLLLYRNLPCLAGMTFD